MGKREGISMEVKVVSCRDLKALNLLHKLAVYAIVSMVTDSDEEVTNEKKEYDQQRQKTPVDGEGGRNPEWNHCVRFDLQKAAAMINGDEDNLFLKFELRCKGVIFGNRRIGDVRVPFKDLIEEFDGNGVSRYVSYQVRNSDGKPNGVLNFSYKVNFTGKENGEANSKKEKTLSTPRPAVELPSAGADQHPPVVDDVVKVEHRSRLYPCLDDIVMMDRAPNCSSSPAITHGYGTTPIWSSMKCASPCPTSDHQFYYWPNEQMQMRELYSQGPLPPPPQAHGSPYQPYPSHWGPYCCNGATPFGNYGLRRCPGG